jgi:hypothetical protein
MVTLKRTPSKKLPKQSSASDELYKFAIVPISEVMPELVK